MLLSLLLTLRIINNKSNPAFKIAWLIPILLFPVLGGLVYLVFGSDRTGKYIRNKMGRIEKEMQDGISKATSVRALKNAAGCGQSVALYLQQRTLSALQEHNGGVSADG